MNSVKGLRASAILIAIGKAPRWARDKIQDVMAQLRPEGYKQAVELLVKGDLKPMRLRSLDVTVVVGDADTITPPVGCRLSQIVSSIFV